MNSPIIIIGAGRSGTNMLRDILVQLPGLGTWPCDEINYIWRHGNRDFPTDRFTPEMAAGKPSVFVQKQFEKLAAEKKLNVVVEKTCANTLRVGFVNEIFPDAQFIQIIRDGRDVATSAAQRWNAKLDIGYIAAKAKYVPKSDLFYYASRYFINRIHRMTSGRKRLSTWGPKFDNMEEVFRKNSLPVGCAMQWQACVRAAAEDFEQIDSARVFNLSYEEFTADPARKLSALAEFVGHEIDKKTAIALTENVTDKSVGRWKSRLSKADSEAIHKAIGNSLEQFGYE